ncbi:MAG: hypothetical protein GY822_27635 [Deltaproteobacteria bacterium]|nr:hypothetical protein [Deltaproteobacteria bacterium]
MDNQWLLPPIVFQLPSRSAALLPLVWLQESRSSRRNRKLVLLSLLIFLFPVIGCAENWTSGRDVFRVAAYRSEPGSLQVQQGNRPKLNVRKSALRRREREELSEEARDAFLAALPKGVPVSTGGPSVRLQKCKLRVALGKKHTLYEARCRAALLENNVVLVAVDARAYRQARSIALPKGTRAEKDGKNPYIDDGHVKEVLLAAARTAGRMILDREMRPPPLDDTAAVLDASVQRLFALENISAEDASSRTGALIDLGTYGASEDALLIAPFLDDTDPLVRRAAVIALAEMAVPAHFSALARRCSWGPPSQQHACEKGLLRMQAQSPSLKNQPRLSPLVEPIAEHGASPRLMRRGFFEKTNEEQTMGDRKIIGDTDDDEEAGSFVSDAGKRGEAEESESIESSEIEEVQPDASVPKAGEPELIPAELENEKQR